jgi:hypothetical protein
MPPFREFIVANISEKADSQFFDRFEPDVFWEKYSTKIIWGVIAVGAIGLIALWSQRQAAERIEIATEKLSRTTDPTDLHKLAEDFKGNQIGAQALLRLAEVQYQSGHLSDVVAAYHDFIATYPENPLIDTARLGEASMLEAQGHFEDAKKEYLLIAARPTSYAANAAKLGAARCSEALGQTKEAFQYYQELMPTAGNTSWELPVAVRLAVLARTMQPAQASPSQPVSQGQPGTGTNEAGTVPVLTTPVPAPAK